MVGTYGGAEVARTTDAGSPEGRTPGSFVCVPSKFSSFHGLAFECKREGRKERLILLLLLLHFSNMLLIVRGRNKAGSLCKSVCPAPPCGLERDPVCCNLPPPLGAFRVHRWPFRVRERIDHEGCCRGATDSAAELSAG